MKNINHYGLMALVAMALFLKVDSSSALNLEKAKGYIGVSLRALNDEEQKAVGGMGGCVIAAIALGSPAEKAGLKANDIVIACNGKPMTNSAEFVSLLKGLSPKDEVVITAMRGGEKREIKITVGKPAESALRAPWASGDGVRTVIVMTRPSNSAASAVLVPPEEKECADILRKAEAHEKNGEWNEASELYQSLIENVADRVMALGDCTFVGVRYWCESHILGDAERLKAYRECFNVSAQQLFKEALDHRDYDAVKNLAGTFGLTSSGDAITVAAGLMAMEEGKHSEAISFFKRLLQIYPGSSRIASIVYPSLYFCYSATGNRGELALLRSAIEKAGAPKSDILINQKKVALASLLASAPPSAPSEEPYGTFAGYFTPKGRAPAVGEKAWSWTIPDPSPQERSRSQVTLMNGMTVDLPDADDAKAHLYPSSQGGEIVLSKSGKTVAIDIKKGTVREDVRTEALPSSIVTPGRKPWETDPNKYRVKSDTVLANNALYLCYELFDREHSLSEFHLCKIDIPTGAFLWTTMLCSSPRSSEAPLYHSLSCSQGTIYVATNAGMIAAVDANSGSIKWIHTYEPLLTDAKETIVIDSARPETYQGSSKGPKEYRLRKFPVMVWEGLVIVFPADNPMLLALDAADGKLRWKYDVDRQYNPLLEGIVNGRVILSMNGAAAVDAASGREIWRWKDDAVVRAGKGALTNDALFIPTNERIVKVALNDGSAETYCLWRDPETEAGSLMVLKGMTVSISHKAITGFVGVE